MLAVITPQYWPSRGPSALYFHALMRGVDELGIPGKLFCSGGTDVSDGQMAHIQVVRHGAALEAGLNRWRRIGRLLGFHCGAFWFVVRERHRVSTWIVDGPLYWNLGAIIAMHMMHTRFVYLVHDLYPEVLVHAGLLSKGGLIVRLAQWLEDMPMRRAEQVYTLTDGMTAALVARLPQECQVDTLPFPIHPIFIERAGRGTRVDMPNNKPVLVYAGGVGIAHYLKPFLAWSRKLGGEQGSMTFRLVADYAGEPDIEACETIEKREPVSWDEVPGMYEECSAGYVGLPPGWGDGSLPSKTFSILASGRPVVVVADESSELFKLVERQGVGLALTHAEAESPSGILKLELFLQDKQTLLICGERARVYAIGCRSPQAIGRILCRKMIGNHWGG